MPSIAQSTWFRNLNDTGQAITNGRAHLKKVIIVNTTVAAAFLQFFDAAAASVTLGTTRPRLVIQVAASAMVDEEWFEMGDPYDTQCTVFSTTTAEGNTGSAAGVFMAAWIN